jgi:hypothetical protein
VTGRRSDQGPVPDYAPSVDREEFLGAIAMAHRELAQLVGRISDDGLRHPAMGDWTGKDMVAHLAWWHDHSVLVIEELREGGRTDDGKDPANSVDGINERVHREHLDDPPDVTRLAFDQSFERLLEAIKTLTDEDLFAANRWPSLGEEPLVEVLLWDTSRHYAAHLEHLAPLAQADRN